MPEKEVPVGVFRDRRAAGRLLGERLAEALHEPVVVLGVPRGGVAVAHEVAVVLGAPLDVVLARACGVPFQRELLDREAARYRAVRPPEPLAGRTVVVVDDGIATGKTMLAACRVARARGARRVVAAVPVAPPSSDAALHDVADEVVCLERPRGPFAVARYYRNFAQVTEDEAVSLLADPESASGAQGRPDQGPGSASAEHRNGTELRPKVVETHTSVLFFLQDRVVKVRKSIAYGFADFTDIRRRRRDCEREVTLNRRLSPDVYLGAATIRMGGEVVEHAVVMRRLPEDRSLAALVDEGADIGGHLDRVAAVLARFHAGAVRSPGIARRGSAAAQWRRWCATAGELDRFVGGPIDPATYVESTELAGEYLAGRSTLFTRRISEGAVCDGHGDLQAADVYCLDDGPRLLDCLEFDDRLRYGDVLADVAFLAVDLERLGVPEAAERLFARYRSESGRDQPDSLVHFYLAARAQVRLLVECIRAEQGLGRSSPASVAAWVELLAGHLRAARARVVLVGGPPGSGKSTLAASLARQLGWEVVSTDHLRQVVACPSPGGDRYSEPAKAAVYDAVVARAEELVRDGRSVLLDATWARAAQRAHAADMALRASAQLLELRCECPPAIAAARIVRRLAARSGESEATTDVAVRLKEAEDHWPGTLTVTTGGTEAAALRTARALLSARGIRPYRPLAGRPPPAGL